MREGDRFLDKKTEINWEDEDANYVKRNWEFSQSGRLKQINKPILQKLAGAIKEHTYT